MEKYIKNVYKGLVHLTKGIMLRPAGSTGDTVFYKPEFDNDIRIQKLIKKGVIEVVNTFEEPEEEEVARPVYRAQKPQQQQIKITRCLGVTKKGVQCSTDVTFRGKERPPLCGHHMSQIDQVEWDEQAQMWVRKT